MNDRTIVLGLGTNLGDRLAHLRDAYRALSVAPVAVEAASRIYETEPIGPPQPLYLNAALRVRTGISLLDLLEIIHRIERGAGRERRERWGPRTLDIDILWAEGETVDSPALVVPHPGLLDRAFALAPLLDVLAEAPAGFSERLVLLGGPPSPTEHTFLLPK